MDPVQKLYMFYHWIEDEKERSEILKNHAYTIGGFSNPEMLNKILDKEDQSNQVSSTDEDFEKSLQIIKQNEESNKTNKRKRRKKIGT